MAGVVRVLSPPQVQDEASTHLSGPVTPKEKPKKRVKVRGQMPGHMENSKGTVEAVGVRT